MKNRFKDFKNSNFKKIFIHRKIDNKYNFLISLPRSGSSAIRFMLSSYFEIQFKIGNGIPKYNPITNKYIYSLPIIESTELQNLLEYDNLNYNRNISFFENYISKEEFERKK